MAVILIVEDHPPTCAILGKLFRRIGHAAVCLASAEEMLRVVGTVRADVVLLDVMLPGMDGLAALAHLRAAPATRALPVFTYTALGDLETAARARALGATGHILKGTPFADLLLHLYPHLPRGEECRPAGVR